MNKLMCFLIVFCFISVPNALAINVKVATTEIIEENYYKLLEGKKCQELDKFDSSYALDRKVIELIFICQAFHLVQGDYQLQFVKSGNYQRSLVNAANGTVHMTSETLWQRDIDKSAFYISDEIIRSGEFEQGFYVHPDNEKILQIKSPLALKEFKAVGQKNWVLDWDILTSLELKFLYSTSRLNNKYNMVGHGRVDFMLWTFSKEPDMSQTVDGIRLIPIPGIKVGMNDSRHFVISKKAEGSKQVYAALQEGIKLLRAQGTITKGFKESGFFHPKATDWIVYPAVE